MRWLIVIACACGGGAQRGPRMQPEQTVSVPIRVEWKVADGGNELVNVSLVVDGTTLDLEALEGTSMHELGGPHTCALRAANPRRTEIMCGQGNGYTAQLEAGVLVIRHIDSAGDITLVRDVPVNGDILSVQMLALPGSKL
ncbi:MAG TPA: hypothetical protein VIV40_29000 [Kofleriaceae bacterium]